MFGKDGRDVLCSGIIEPRAGNREAARRYLDRCAWMSGDRGPIAEIGMDDGGSIVLIDGHSGAVAGEPGHSRVRSGSGVLDWLGDLLSE